MDSEQNRPIRLLLIDDQEVVRTGLRMLLESWNRLEVVAEANDPNQALATAASLKPDIVLADLDRGLRNNILDQIPDLISFSGGRVILLTAVTDSSMHSRAMALGAAGIVMKSRAADDLLRAIEKVHEGELWFSRKLTADLVAELSRSNIQKDADPEVAMLNLLTAREREVAALVCEGLKNKEIGARLFISETTVRHHMSSIFDKLKVGARFELLVFLHRHKFVPDD
jgi:two-component system nitrate/nitrite response regulator NarL